MLCKISNNFPWLATYGPSMRLHIHVPSPQCLTHPPSCRCANWQSIIPWRSAPQFQLTNCFPQHCPQHKMPTHTSIGNRLRRSDARWRNHQIGVSQTRRFCSASLPFKMTSNSIQTNVIVVPAVKQLKFNSIFIRFVTRPSNGTKSNQHTHTHARTHTHIPNHQITECLLPSHSSDDSYNNLISIWWCCGCRRSSNCRKRKIRKWLIIF